MLQKVESKMFVQLATDFDDCRFGQMSRSEQVEELGKPDANIFFEVASLKDAVILCQSFIQRYNLGSSNWAGGLVVNQTSDFIANISYNGRIWDNKDWRVAKEIIL
jgi:hypothetical protein